MLVSEMCCYKMLFLLFIRFLKWISVMEIAGKSISKTLTSPAAYAIIRLNRQ